ncbi:hypothetical protein I5M34_08450 [Pseudomonas aeruginosa]|nr:hypothetical protein [Pseudomonas aeruginosa]
MAIPKTAAMAFFGFVIVFLLRRGSLLHPMLLTKSLGQHLDSAGQRLPGELGVLRHFSERVQADALDGFAGVRKGIAHQPEVVLVELDGFKQGQRFVMQNVEIALHPACCGVAPTAY